MKKNITLFLALLLMAGSATLAQVAINTDGSQPAGSAMLDIKSINKGMLIPQITLTGTTDGTTISSPATSLMVYNTATASNVTPGYYYNSGTPASPVWTRLSTNSAADGSETKVIAGTNVAVTGTGTLASPYIINASTGTSSSHYVGELYGGGVVFWVDQTGQHGLIVSMIEPGTGMQWSNVTTTSANTNDWDGLSNSNKIVGQSGHSNSAAKVCLDYTNADYGTGIYSDWYLPSITELNHLWINSYQVQKALESDGNPATIKILRVSHWSSTEQNPSQSYYFDISLGYSWPNGKNNTVSFRAVRAF
jgi:hypothetical protein